MWPVPRYDHNRFFIALMAVLVALAWLALWVSGWSSHHGFLHSLHSLEAFGGGFQLVVVFIVGWTVMIVAMMLPTSLPLIMLFRGFTRQREDRARLTALLIAGYLVAWALFGAVVYFGGWILHRVAGQSAWLETNAPFLAAGVVALAGLYQFTPLKYHCLEKCRSPLSFIAEHWRGSREQSRAFRLGAHHGLFCVGCCWSLMLLMFLVGAAGALVWMLVLGAVMAVEKNVSWGRRIGFPLGVLLLGAGLTFGTAQALQPPGGTTAGTTAGENAGISAGTNARVSLAPVGGSGVSGEAVFTDTANGVEVELQARNLPEPGEMYLAHLHPGSCAEDPADGAHHDGHDHSGSHDDTGHGDHPADHSTESVGEIEHPVEPLAAGADGGASSLTEIEGVTVARLFSGEGGFHINVHAEASGSGELPTAACGDLSDNAADTQHDHEEEHHDPLAGL